MGFQWGKIFACLTIFENDLKNCYKAGHRHRVYGFQANSEDEGGGEEERWDWTYSNVMISTRFKGTQTKRWHSTSLGSGVKFSLVALSFCMKATWPRSLSEGTFQFRNVQRLQILWWITAWWNLRGWVITFGFLPASREVQKVTFMGMGKISNPGISVLNRIKVREEGEGKKKKSGEIMGQPKIFWVSWMCPIYLVSGRPISPGKTHGFQRHLHNCSTTVVQDLIHFLTLCRSCGE